MDKQHRAEDYSKLKGDESKLLAREVYSWSAKESEKQNCSINLTQLQ